MNTATLEAEPVIDTVVPRIQQGKNAGQPVSITDVVTDRLRELLEASKILRTRRFVIVGVDVLGGHSPRITISTCAACQDLGGIPVEWETDALGRYTRMQARLNGVRVQWIERGH